MAIALEGCARRSSWGWQIWRGIGSNGERRGAMSNRRRGRVSVPDPRVDGGQVAVTGDAGPLYGRG